MIGIERSTSPRGAVLAGPAALALLGAGTGLWAARTTIAGAVVATGRIEVDRNRQVVQHPDGGTVAEIAVAEGDSVTAGQLLLRLDPGDAASELAMAEGQLAELMARRARLIAEREGAAEAVFDAELLAAARRRPDVADVVDGQRRLHAARLDTLAQQQAQLDRRREQIAQQIRGLDAQAEALHRQADLIGEDLARERDLQARGLTGNLRVAALDRELAGAQGELGQIAAARAEAEERRSEVDLERLGLSVARREEAIAELRDLGLKEMELVEARSRLRARLALLDIRAPVAGIVHGLAIHAPQSVVRPADPLLYLVPQDRPLIAAIQIDARKIAEVYPGQEVRLRLPSGGSADAPEIAGRTETLSPDAFADETTGRAFYLARVAIPAEQRGRLPRGTALLPGLPVEAFLRTRDRTALSWLTGPLINYFARALREG